MLKEEKVPPPRGLGHTEDGSGSGGGAPRVYNNDLYAAINTDGPGQGGDSGGDFPTGTTAASVVAAGAEAGAADGGAGMRGGRAAGGDGRRKAPVWVLVLWMLQLQTFFLWTGTRYILQGTRSVKKKNSHPRPKAPIFSKSLGTFGIGKVAIVAKAAFPAP